MSNTADTAAARALQAAAAAGAAGFGGAAGVAGAAGFALTCAFALSLAAGLAVVEVTRLDRPKRCTLPITALRVTPPNSLAITLADWPSPHIFFRTSTRSSVQDITPPLEFRSNNG